MIKRPRSEKIISFENDPYYLSLLSTILREIINPLNTNELVDLGRIITVQGNKIKKNKQNKKKPKRKIKIKRKNITEDFVEIDAIDYI